ncbi:MAG TPA: prepilin-type N-terminal cleavage/methylation domain-containing protein [Phycisphaerae bacterium]|nr:prepilin-type N-terminal cleavage/methylation domain-containing protein [Phycisphaerae bacterium]
MKKTKAFTLIELLVVVAIIALLISILLPSLSRARELSKRTVCGANVRGVGQAFYIYAQDDPGTFPAIASTTTSPEGGFQVFNSTDRSIEPSTTGCPSPTVDMWAIVRANNTTPKQYICPSTSDVQDPAQDTTVYYDFNSATNLSYAYQYQHDPNRRVIGTSSEPTFPVLGDANPYIKGGLVIGADLVKDRTGAGRGNSFNHTGREGQTVLYQDGHATFEKGPDCGLSGDVGTTPAALKKISRGRDNIYTVHERNKQVDAGSVAPTLTGAGCTGLCNLGDQSDTCLIP